MATNFPSAITTTQRAGALSQTDFPKHTFSQIDLSHICFATNGTYLVSSTPMHVSTPFPTLHILSTPFELTSSSSQIHSLVSQPYNSSVPTTSSPQPITSITTSIYLTPASIISTSSTTIPSISMQIVVPKTPHPAPLVTIPERTLSTTEDMVEFGEYVLVSLGQYFWSRKYKVVVRKGSKRSREGTFKQGSVPNQII